LSARAPVVLSTQNSEIQSALNKTNPRQPEDWQEGTLSKNKEDQFHQRSEKVVFIGNLPAFKSMAMGTASKTRSGKSLDSAPELMVVKTKVRVIVGWISDEDKA
jgi:hypothetical protein